ncbi:efflux RND transporter periplasmic adaptor subunit [Cypionkella sp.]|uniref:efflux RND transporter periplasmic adaptor subunit n=1 Tax=Cypionkella sp. TaxID=2811411 RepID=UPI0027262D93|nr:HlyD family efflux transporter periplasmic adaptor subunit [Cypionkella sp.]MDO8986417.1 HlyD family efflux transporter periplasmic adaptor subunit [Cypionkella sp.]MDP1576449.1 HlyD family efflux transporter periplasmic adaptor subunit [Cypionkella sp.]MDP2048242.1 HlyD family efflux transporter periplasmic adaptor subunit [Cypionkella sp.]
MVWLKRAFWSLGVVVAVAAVAWFVWPRPVPVDLATATLGPMEVTIDDEARTNLRHVYTVTAPVTGTVLRIASPDGAPGEMSVHVGDRVIAGETVVAVLQPMPPPLIDVRSRQELEAAATAADAAVQLAEAEVMRMAATLQLARDNLTRAEKLSSTDVGSAKSLEVARTDVAVNEAGLASAKAQLEVRRSEVNAARARLDPASATAPGDPDCCIKLRAPASGVVLAISQESEGIVQAGTPLLKIGDPTDLEIVADLLSTDAVKVKSGAAVMIDGWGGAPLKGTVVRVEPNGFVKISALGIEEMRVRTVIDLVDPPQDWSTLGNDFRVIVHISLWDTASALTVPVAALFRQGDDWAVFALRDGRARTAVVELGHRNERVAEVLSGLVAADEVILHPNDRVADGVAVAQREVQ